MLSSLPLNSHTNLRSNKVPVPFLIIHSGKKNRKQIKPENILYDFRLLLLLFLSTSIYQVVIQELTGGLIFSKWINAKLNYFFDKLKEHLSFKSLSPSW